MTSSIDAPKRHGFWKRAWLRVKAQWNGEPLVRVSVRHDDHGITVDRFRVEEMVPETTVVRWVDVKRVEAFKRDRLTFDDICVGVAFDDDWWIEVDENMDGFHDLINDLPRHLRGCLPRDRWWVHVMKPAFETNLTVLWERAKSDAV